MEINMHKGNEPPGDEPRKMVMRDRAEERVYRFHEYGGPETLRLDNEPSKEPGHGEVREDCAVHRGAKPLDRLRADGPCPGAPFPWLPASLRSSRSDRFAVIDDTGNRHLELLGDEAAFARARHFAGNWPGDGSLPPVQIDREFRELGSLPDALGYMASNLAAGKIVLTL